jgi:hypothetical protein
MRGCSRRCGEGGGGGSSGSSSSSGPVARRRPRALAAALPLLLASFVLLLLTPTPSDAWGTEMSPSVGLFRLVDLSLYEGIQGKNATRCEHMVDKAGRTGATMINFVLTHYYVDEDGDYTPERFCYKAGTGAECTAFTPAAVEEWVRLFKPCLAYAVGLGFDIAYTPHLDDGLNAGQWRNAMLIDPLAKYGGMSYFDVVLEPLARAASETIKPSTRVWFALQGEMSAMVTRFPENHRRILPYLRKITLPAGRDDLWYNVRVGVSTNFNKLCGMDMCQKAEVDAEYDKEAVQRLYDECDFIGMSGYPRFKGSLLDMEDSTRMFDDEAKLFGIDLAELITTGGKELVFNEFGIGGGVSVTGDAPARTVEQASSFPFFGVYGPYTRRLDPWRNYLPPYVVSGTREYMHDWYRAASVWLQRKGGPKWRVDHAMLWSLNSWDVLGISVESNTREGSYRDPEAAAIVRAHNLKVRGLEGFDNAGGTSPYRRRRV